MITRAIFQHQGKCFTLPNLHLLGATLTVERFTKWIEDKWQHKKTRQMKLEEGKRWVKSLELDGAPKSKLGKGNVGLYGYTYNYEYLNGNKVLDFDHKDWDISIEGNAKDIVITNPLDDNQLSQCADAFGQAKANEMQNEVIRLQEAEVRSMGPRYTEAKDRIRQRCEEAEKDMKRKGEPKEKKKSKKKQEV
jgi:hypothetical protein